MSRRGTFLAVICLGAGLATVAHAEPLPAASAGRSAATEQRARVLETITIEGQIEAPQVQFITSRDRLRFADDAGRRFRPGALAVLDQLRAPVRLRLVAPPGCPPLQSIPSP